MERETGEAKNWRKTEKAEEGGQQKKEGTHVLECIDNEHMFDLQHRRRKKKNRVWGSEEYLISTYLRLKETEKTVETEEYTRREDDALRESNS